jgi:CRP/FNR family transcriptional regulator, anaerobic regulatory protein
MARLSRSEQVALLARLLTRLNGVPPRSFDAFAALFRGRLLERGEYFVRAGEESVAVALVCAGVARLFYTRADGKEFNKGFVSAPDFMSVLESLITQQPSRLNVQALTPMQLFVAPYSGLSSFFARDPYWERLGRRIVEQVYVKKVRREASLLMDSAAERYSTFVEEHGAVSDAVPDYHVAAYLGITPETLSRLKKRITGKPSRS